MMNRYLKVLTILMMATFSCVNLAADTNKKVTLIKDGAEVIRAFILNPSIIQKLKKHGLHDVEKMTREKVASGVTLYKVYLATCGNCFPKTGVVLIEEDIRPSYADGPIKFKVELKLP